MIDQPLSRPSILSVSFLTTSTGLPNEGNSSCKPPESVITRLAISINDIKER